MVVSPGQRCAVGLATPEFHVFPDVAVFGRNASSSDLNARATVSAALPELSAERQEDGSYVIRELGSRTIELPRP